MGASDESYAAQIGDNVCFNCNRKGRWAKDCRQKPKQPGRERNRRPPGRPQNGKVDNATTKGTLYKNEKTNFINKYRNHFSRKKDPQTVISRSERASAKDTTYGVPQYYLPKSCCPRLPGSGCGIRPHLFMFSMPYYVSCTYGVPKLREESRS